MKSPDSQRGSGNPFGMRIDVDLASFDICLNGSAVPAADLDAPVAFVQGAPRDVGGEQPLSVDELRERYLRYGERLPAHLHGPFAILVVDRRRRLVIAANDRMSLRGWCFATRRGRLSFADRADMLADGADLDHQALFAYLFHHVIPSPATIFDGVQRMQPGSCLVAQDGRQEIAPYWQPVFQSGSRLPSVAELSDEFRSLLRTAVDRAQRSISDDQIGAFLSGGTDSSTVCGTLQGLLGSPLRAYSVGFDVEGYDEMTFARIAARHFGLDHREHYMAPGDVAAAMPAVAAHFDQPFGNSSAVAAFHCARAARADGCSVLFAGDGGDELFGGNARYAKQRQLGFYENVPLIIRERIVEPMFSRPEVARLPGIAKLASYVEQAKVPMPDRLQMYNLLLRIGLQDVLTTHFLAAVSLGEVQHQDQIVYDRTKGASLIDRMLAFDWKLTLADNDLPKVIGATELADTSSVFPLLSDELIDFSLKLPPNFKLRGLKLRWFFKEALRSFLPAETIAKRKQGFGLPFGVWVLQHSGLRQLIDDALANFSERGLVRPAFLRRLQSQLLPSHPGYYGELVWIFVMLELWLRARRPDWRFSDGA